MSAEDPSSVLLPLVLAGHFVGDWVLQTDAEAQNKAAPGLLGWLAMASHVASYTAALGAFTVWALGIHHPIRWLVLLAASAVTHAVIDRRWPVRWLMAKTGSPRFAETSWGVLATDQALHLSILCVLVAVVS